MLLIFGFMIVEGRGLNPTISVGADTLHFAASSYKTSIAFSQFDSVVLRPQLHGVKRRLGGMQVGNTYVGQFEVVPFGRTMLFVNAIRKPYIYFYTRKGVVVATSKDSVSAETLARTVRQRIASRVER